MTKIEACEELRTDVEKQIEHHKQWYSGSMSHKEAVTLLTLMLRLLCIVRDETEPSIEFNPPQMPHEETF